MAEKAAREAEFLTEKELRIVTVCVMHHPKIKEMWFKLRKSEKSKPWRIIRAYDDNLMRVTAEEVKILLMRLSGLAGCDEEVKKHTTRIFEEDLGREAPGWN